MRSSKSHSRRRKRRFTSRERANRISQRIRKAGKRGISVRQIASRERLSISRTYRYLHQIREKRKRRTKIERLDKRYYYVEPSPIAPRAKLEELRELRGYINYASARHRSADIDIDCVMLVEHYRVAILAGSREITDRVERRFGRKLGSMLKFGVSPATAGSANHFLFRRQGGEWVEF